MERSKDWFRQARIDLENAKWEMEGGFYEWAIFSAQQAAEKALKALYQRFGGTAWGHSIYNLLKGLMERIDIPKDLFEIARRLDSYYVITRYPNGFDAGTPHDYFTKEDSIDAIRDSEKILRFCEGLLAGLEGTDETT